jgi:hypothetical protein
VATVPQPRTAPDAETLAGAHSVSSLPGDQVGL